MTFSEDSSIGIFVFFVKLTPLMIVFTASAFTLKPLYSLSLPINSNVSIFPISKDKSFDSSSGICEISNVILFAPDEATACAISTFDAVAVILGEFSNAFSPSFSISSGSVNSSNDEQPLKASLPIFVTPGLRTYCSDEHPSNVDSGISFINLPSCTATISLLFLNNPGAIPVTFTDL